MPKSPIAKLTVKQANPKDRDTGWDDPELCSGPHALLDYIVKYLFVDIGEFANTAKVVLSSSKPAASDNNKIWGKTSAPYGIGVYSGGWKMIYQHPTNSPFLFNESTGFPSYLTKMSKSEYEGAGLTEPTDSKWVYAIFRPPTYS